MIEVKEVKTKKDIREFLNFPLRLYKGNPYFVPPMYADEKKMFKPDYYYYSTCESVFFIALQDGKTVGRIQGILQKASNEIRNEKRVRFTRFDSIDSQEVAQSLFQAVEKWALSKGMDTVVGPLGFSDLEREGLLIEGFDQLSTFEEQYSYEYYPSLISNLGYEKEVDWTESRIFLPENENGAMQKRAEYVLKRHNLHIGTASNIRKWLKKYKDQFFDLLEKSYANIYGTVPFSEGMKKALIANFKLIINLSYVAVVVDENDKAVCFGLCFPSIAKPMQKCKGKLTPLGIIRLLWAIKHPEIIDLALIGVDPDYLNLGISAVFAAGLMNILKNPKIKYAETNLNLEDNAHIQNLWKRFREEKHKRRRCYIKKLV